jgi:hypothetical protein
MVSLLYLFVLFTKIKKIWTWRLQIQIEKNEETTKRKKKKENDRKKNEQKENRGTIEPTLVFPPDISLPIHFPSMKSTIWSKCHKSDGHWDPNFPFTILKGDKLKNQNALFIHSM